MASVISLFNHKGGVSKTTTAFNLGWMLARKNQRVMLVDCDPQCNLTGMVLGYTQSNDTKLIEGSTADAPRNIRDALAPAFESRPALIRPVRCVNVPGNERLFLLPGHIGLAEYEVTLGIAQELSGSVVTLRNLPGAIRYLINQTVQQFHIDLVLIDMSPSLGALNQNLFTTSDFFLVPMHPDYFAMMAIKSLSAVLPKWKDWSRSAQNLAVLREAEYPFPQVSPKFLGYVLQKYRPRSGVPSRAFQEWIDQIEVAVSDQLIPVLRNSDMMLPDDVYKKAKYDPIQPLLQMPDFNSLIARSQEHRVPIFALTDTQLDQAGVVLDATKKSMKDFEKLFSKAADRTINVIRYATGN